MTFNAEAFKQAAISEANSDRFQPVSEGDYKGTIIKAEVAAGEAANGPWARYDITLQLQDPVSGEPRNVRGGIMLDLNDSGGLSVAPNRNITLGQLRTACGLNVQGKPFHWEDAVGHEVLVTIKHRADKTDPTKKYENFVSFKAAY
jgi:hypothetical protein